jgi:hypothetical protein
VGELGLHGARQAEPLGQHLGHLAERGDVAPVLADGARELADDERGPLRGRAVQGRQRPREGPHGLDARPEHHRREVRVDVVLEELRGDVRIRRAADV